jgi:hypothetical protein
MDSPLSLPPGRWWIEGGNFGRSESHKLAALVRGAPGPASNPCSACTAPVRGWALPSVGGRCSAPPSDGIAAEAPDLKVEISSV